MSARGGVEIGRTVLTQPYAPADSALAEALDSRRGVLFSSSFEFPGRYSRWDMGFVDPPLVFTARGREFSIEALNARGAFLLPAVAEAVAVSPAVSLKAGDGRIAGDSPRPTNAFPRKSAAGSLRSSRSCAR